MIALLTSFGVASRTGAPCWAAASSTTPARLADARTPSGRCCEKKSRSTATRSGWWSAISSSTQRVDGQQPLGQRRSGLVVETAVVDLAQPSAGPFDDPVAQRGGPRVDPEDDHPATSAKTSSGMSKLAVTRCTSSRSSSSSTSRSAWRALRRIELDGLLGDHRRLGRLDRDAGRLRAPGARPRASPGAV